MRTSLLFVALAIGAAFGGHDANATSLVALSTEQLTDASDLIVRGTVTDVWAELDTDGKCWTRARVDVDRALKGTPAEPSVVVSQMGGICGSVVARVASTARFSVGEEGYFFLEQLNDYTSVVGLVQGKFTLRMDPTVRHEIVMRFTVPSDQPYDARFLPLPQADQRIAAADFEKAVVDRVAVGWDGSPIPGATTAHLQAVNHLPPAMVK